MLTLFTVWSLCVGVGVGFKLALSSIYGRPHFGHALIVAGFWLVSLSFRNLKRIVEADELERSRGASGEGPTDREWMDAIK